MLMTTAVCERRTEKMPPFGLILHGAPFGFNLSSLSTVWLKELVDEHKLLILRDFELLDPVAFANWGRRWGELLGWGDAEVLDLTVQRRPMNSFFTHDSVPLHWDGAFAALEPRFLMYQCLQAPAIAGGGETLFCNTQRVLQHAGGLERARWEQVFVSYYSSQPEHHWAEITVPLVDTHPTTGAPRLRFTEPPPESADGANAVSIRIEGMHVKHQEKLFDDLAPHLYARTNCYTHSWRPKDLVIADNSALLHGRKGFNIFSKRHLQHLRVL